MFSLPNPISHVSCTAFTQARACSAQARLIFGSGLLRSAHPYCVTRRSQDLPPQKLSNFNEGPEKALPIARAPKYVTTYTIPTNMEDSKKMLSTPCFKNSVSCRLCNFRLRLLSDLFPIIIAGIGYFKRGTRKESSILTL
jgi:hypothetical protein